MTVRELNRDQLAELKTNYLIELGNELSYEDLVNIHDLVPDQEVFDAYNGVNFVPDDFFCSAGQEEEDPIANKFIVSDGGRYFLHATSSINYEWSDWAATIMNKRTAQDALSWARREGFEKAFIVVIMD